MKKSDNTPLIEIDRFKHPPTSTMVDRYILANSWLKNKTVVDAATGKGYGAGITLALGATSVVGIDIDVDGIKDANEKYQSPNCKFEVCDIFNLQEKYKENQFETCTSIETFEHLPPERIDEYLQSIKYVTKETIIITTPRRKVPEWHFQGGTHLYEYDAGEFTDILLRNFEGADITAVMLNEVQLPGGQVGTDLVTDLYWNQFQPGIFGCFFAVVEL